ncbi:MAG: glycosyltransferase family 2 protein [Candidatus Paceibacterota bacterium]
MNNRKEVAVVLVTYNRKNLLLEAIDGVLSQTTKVDHIFIVDNNSTDGTRTMLHEKFGNNINFTLIFLQENTGSAGGFHYGVKKAYEEGYQWVWFLDDDVSPESSCLDVMFSYKNISKCIHPNKKFLDGSQFMWEALFSPSMGSINFMNNVSFQNGKDFTFVNIGCFEGMLINRDIIAKIGFPDRRFFIGGDDVIYGFESSLHTNVIFLKNAFLKKLIPVSEKQKPTALYYSIRNQFLLIKHLKELGLFRPARFYPFLLMNIIFSMTRHVFTTRSSKTPWYVVRAVFDGLRGKFYKMK